MALMAIRALCLWCMRQSNGGYVRPCSTASKPVPTRKVNPTRAPRPAGFFSRSLTSVSCASHPSRPWQSARPQPKKPSSHGIGIIKITAIPQPPPRPSGTPTKIPLLRRGGRRSLTGWCCFTRHHRGYQPQRVHAFYGVRTGFIRRGGVSFFAWQGQLAVVVVSFQEKCTLDDWGAECRIEG